MIDPEVAGIVFQSRSFYILRHHSVLLNDSSRSCYVACFLIDLRCLAMHVNNDEAFGNFCFEPKLRKNSHHTKNKPNCNSVHCAWETTSQNQYVFESATFFCLGFIQGRFQGCPDYRNSAHLKHIFCVETDFCGLVVSTKSWIWICQHLHSNHEKFHSKQERRSSSETLTNMRVRTLLTSKTFSWRCFPGKPFESSGFWGLDAAQLSGFALSMNFIRQLSSCRKKGAEVTFMDQGSQDRLNREQARSQRWTELPCADLVSSCHTSRVCLPRIRALIIKFHKEGVFSCQRVGAVYSSVHRFSQPDVNLFGHPAACCKTAPKPRAMRKGKDRFSIHSVPILNESGLHYCKTFCSAQHYVSLQKQKLRSSMRHHYFGSPLASVRVELFWGIILWKRWPDFPAAVLESLWTINHPPTQAAPLWLGTMYFVLLFWLIKWSNDVDLDMEDMFVEVALFHR